VDKLCLGDDVGDTGLGGIKSRRVVGAELDQ